MLIGLIACPVASRAADRWTVSAGETFQHIVTESNSQIKNPTSLVRDRDGFLWIGSQDGLLRWDGYHFRLYRPNPKDPASLPDNDIRTLALDDAGRLWIGTNTGGLARYDRDHDSFTTFAGGPHGVSHVSVGALAADGRGGLWIGTRGGLDHYDGRTGRIQKGLNSGLPSAQVGAILRDRAGDLWIGTAAGVVHRRAGEGTDMLVPLPTHNGSPVAIRQLYQDSAGRIWIATQRNGAFYIDPGESAPRALSASDDRTGNLQTEGINTVVEASPNVIWLGTLSHGLVVVDMTNLQTRRIVHNALTSTSLLYDEVWCLYRDASGLVWVATGEGLSRWAPEQAAFRVIPGATGQPQDMTEAGALAIAEMPDGHVWTGLTRKGVDILDPLKGRIRSLRSDSAHPETALPQAYVWDLAPHAGTVYIATAQGLYRSPLSGDRVARVHIDGRDPSAYSVALLADGAHMWLGGYDGLWRFRPGNEPQKVEHFKDLTDPQVRVMIKAPDGGLWVGTENGLNRLPASLVAGGAGSIERILPDKADPQGLSGGYISSLILDRQGRLWVGTSGGGIDILVGRDAAGRARFRHIGTDDGLPDQNVDKLLIDDKGRVWASTDSGLAVIDPDTLRLRVLGHESGLSIMNYWVGSGTVTAEHELLLSGTTGVLVVKPDQLRPWTYTPPVVVSDIHIGKDERLAGTFDDSHPLAVPPGKAVSVEFSALDLSAPDQNRYRYRLEGFERDWNETDFSHRVATYTNLLPGHYVLRVQGTNRDGLWSARTLGIPIHVLPAWYQSGWFCVLVALGGALLVYGLVHMRTAYLRLRQTQLTQLVEARTAELHEIQRQLEELAYCDALTGLPNRRMFGDDFRKLLALARREARDFTLLLIDLDGFKYTNDTFGHDAGDALLKEAAVRLRSVLRDSDSVARLGGDEFAILLGGPCSPADVAAICQRVIETFEPSVLFQAHHLKTSPSIGAATFPGDGETEESLYKAADLALYEAKRSGRNTWRHTPRRADALT
jgi:diguanylate cyclase (GGDEF)-like protein